MTASERLTGASARNSSMSELSAPSSSDVALWNTASQAKADRSDSTSDAIKGPLAAGVRAGDPAALGEAHDHLLQSGYQFVGYHGTDGHGRDSLMPHGFDPARAGSGAGSERGAGFYVAHSHALAKDWADGGTTEELSEKPYIKTKEGKAGEAHVLRIYAKDPQTMQPGKDHGWGVQSRAAAMPENGDLKPNADQTGFHPRSGNDLATGQHDLERVFAPHTYSRLAALPEMGGGTLKPTPWKAHEDGDVPSIIRR